MGFSNFKALLTAIDAGQVQYSSWRKTPSQATTIGVWTDMSMSPGNPIPNYYASPPLVADTLDGSRGIYHGGAVSPKTKHLTKLTAMTIASATVPPISFILCDYLLYYPFVDMGTTDIQTMDNTITLPRYSDGEGVKVMAVEVASQIGGQTFQIGYTNENGVSGRTSKTVTCNSFGSNGTIIQTNRAVAGSNGPFIPLQNGDTGIRSIESFTMNGADVGLLTLVLVKPIASFHIFDITAPVEVDFLLDRPSLPKIVDGAYLNFLACPGGATSLATIPFYGDMTFTWG